MGSISYPYYDNSEKRTNYVEQQPDSTTSSASSTNDNFVVFTEGVTRQQIESATNKKHLASLFEKYNKDGDDVISHDEFQTFFKENVETSRSKTRVATGGKYIVQKGDSLDAIARDFRTTAYELYKMNKSVIGNDINKIQIGMELVIFDYMLTEDKDHDCDHVHEGEHAHEGEETSGCSEYHSCDSSKAYAEIIKNLHDKKANFYSILKSVSPNSKATNMKEFGEEFSKLDEQDKNKILTDGLIATGFDPTKVDMTIFDGGLKELLTHLDPPLTIEEFRNLGPDEKADARNNALKNKLEKDLNQADPNSRLSQQLAIIEEEGYTAEEKEIYDDIVKNNPTLSDEQIKLQIAERRVREIYNTSDLAQIALRIQKSQKDEALAGIEASLERYEGNQASKDFLANILYYGGRLNGKERTRLANEMAEHGNLASYSEEDIGTSMIEALVTGTTQAVAESATDEEAIKTFADNSGEYAPLVKEVFTQVAETTTDVSRKEMLSKVVDYITTTVIPNQEAKATSKSESNADLSKSSGTASSSASTSSAQTSSASVVSNPIAPQFQSVADIRQASQAFEASRRDADAGNVIPEHLRNDFKIVREYLEFKPTGMSVAKFREIKQALQQDFPGAIGKIIKNYSIVPDKYKGQIFNFFACMDKNTSCELYIEGNAETRQFMKKYQYMNDAKLLAYAETHHDEVKGASKEVRLLIEELQKDAEKSHA